MFLKLRTFFSSLFDRMFSHFTFLMGQIQLHYLRRCSGEVDPIQAVKMCEKPRRQFFKLWKVPEVFLTSSVKLTCEEEERSSASNLLALF